MRNKFTLTCLLASLLLYAPLFAQKKVLDHTVYDGWQSIPEKVISNDGKYVGYAVNPQQGDGMLFVKQADGKELLETSRGYAIRFSADSRYVVFKIRPPYNDTRDARIKKKKPTDMPKDSLGILDLVKGVLLKKAAIDSYKMPEEAGGWIAYLAEKTPPRLPVAAKPDSITLIKSLTRVADSLMRLADSLKQKLAEVKINGLTVLEPEKKSSKENLLSEAGEEEKGALLTLRNLQNGTDLYFNNVVSYEFDKKSNALLMVLAKKKGDANAKGYITWYHLSTGVTDTVMRGLNDVKNIAFDDNGRQVAFVAERDSSLKALLKFYKLWYFKPGMDSATMLVDQFTKGVAAKQKVSEDGAVLFSKSGSKIFFGTGRSLPVKDTTLPEFERVNVDVWNYKDDFLQTIQLGGLNRELQLNFQAVYDLDKKIFTQIYNDTLRTQPDLYEKDPEMFYGSSRNGKLVASQWQGYALEDVYAINTLTATTRLIMKDLKGKLYPSVTRRYLLMYDEKKRIYYIYNSVSGLTYRVAASLKYPLYNEENDVPDDPDAYGVMGWTGDDKHFYIYDRYDIWQIDPENIKPPVMLNISGRSTRTRLRYEVMDADKKSIDPTRTQYFKWFNEVTKKSGYISSSILVWKPSELTPGGAYAYNDLKKAKNADAFIYTRENYQSSPDLYIDTLHGTNPSPVKLTTINAQQAQYNWGTAELYKWKAYTGRIAEGVLYKPENFDAKRKYPMILYFYERNSERLYDYVPPVPTPSRLNISFYVSRGYVVFVPDVWYTTGHPGKGAYDHIVSATRALIKEGFVDSANIGIQGQSWGGYQVVHLITRTNLYKAAWAGAPVVNMFSAYGGIRWESGSNRQFQYEKTQSRIGATIWQKPELYIENSPLFHLPDVKTPLVIMANDADGAVPWYQGIELFTAMRRLAKPVWMLNYNGEAHNLVERKNRKDIQVREQQYFDWLLKGEKPAPWISEGVPAIMKGRTMGL